MNHDDCSFGRSNPFSPTPKEANDQSGPQCPGAYRRTSAKRNANGIGNRFNGDADNRILEIALDGKADVLVTGDQGLLILQTHESIPLLLPANGRSRLN
jgi:hypothetical protein